MPSSSQMQLRDILSLVRAQTGKSLNVALGVAERDALIVLIQTKQLELYYDYDWPSLLTNADTPLVAGTRLYAFPATISFDFVNDVWVSETGGAWMPVGYGIGEPIVRLPKKRLDVRKRRPKCRLHERLRYEAQDDFRDDRQRSLGSNEQMGQVVANDVLDDLPACLDDLSGREHGLEAEHVLLGRAVLERTWAARAFGDIAANHRLPQRRRIGRIEEADLLDFILQVAGDDVRLDDGEEIRFVDLEDAVHPLERDDDASPDRNRPAGVAAAAPAGNDWQAMSRADLHDVRDLARVLREDDDVSGMPALQRVHAVRHARVVVRTHVGRTQYRLELGEDVSRDRHGPACSVRLQAEHHVGEADTTGPAKSRTLQGPG